MPGPAGVRTRVDVEFAHHCAVPCDEALTQREIDASSLVAKGLAERLRAFGVEVVTSVLVDDKKNAAEDIADRRRDAVALSADSLGADRVMLESELVHHLKDLAAALPDSAVLDGFFGRLRRTGELACSQDVTIWHALRLGLFTPTDPRWAWTRVPSGTAPCDVCVAILPRRFQRYEEKAYAENLVAILGPAIPDSGRITLRGRFRGRAAALVAVWVDVEADEGPVPADLYERGAAEAEWIHEICPSVPVLDTIG